MSTPVFRRLRRRSPVLLAASACAALLPTLATATPDRPAASAVAALQQLKQNSAGALSSNLIANDAYATVHAVGRKVLMADNAAAAPLSRAQSFLSIYGAILGVKDPLTELQQTRLSSDGNGGRHVHMDQFYRGLPVFGARVVVHMNDDGITGTNGVFVKDLALSTTPKMSVADLRARGIAAARKLHPKASLSVQSSRLMIYRSGLLKGIEGKNFLAYEVMVQGAPGEAVRERLILNANTGAVLNRINEIHTVLNREIHTPTLDFPAILTEGSALAPADPAFAGDTKGSPASDRPPLILEAPWNNLYVFAGGTYNLYKNLFGREGYDDGFTPPEMQVQRSVYLVNENCPNAYWDGTSTNYCPAFDADDVVSHEWSHAYTEYTHGLVYQYQSGALNESYSDIFGETYDLVNGIEGPLGITLTEGKTYDQHGSRWVVGEDLSEVGAALLLRDMWDPDAFPAPSPGSVIASENYYCDTGDNGGVHTNSGVSNHAFAMLVDGKTFNGHTIPAIGLTKAVHIYFQAETHHQTPTTNFPQHADALEQSCAELIGKPLNDVFGKTSGETIGEADCAAVHTATLAVEFRNTEAMTVAQKCDYQPVLQPEAAAPALCASGKVAKSAFSEDWEHGFPASWTLGKNLTGDTEAPHFAFEISDTLPPGHSGHAAFALDDTGGTCTTGGDQSGSHWMDTPAITLTDDASLLSFAHFMQAEAGYDGGNLKYSVDGAAFAVVPAEAFVYSPHNSEFSQAPIFEGVPDPLGLFGNNTNPLASESAWSGADQGEATGSWGKTIVDLSKLGAVTGSQIVLRWEWGNDGCGGNTGWFVDDVSVAYCAADAGPANTAPTASLSATPLTGTAPLPVSFDASASTDTEGDVLSYTFNFGDGSAAVSQPGATVSHTYTAAGSYTASVVVQDSHGATGSVTVSVAVTAAGGNHAPTAALSASATSGETPLPVDFDASASTDADGDAISEYRFDFGDGSAAVAQASPKISHTYTAAGSFTASVTVKDSAGNVSPQASTTIDVTTTVVVTPGSGPVAALVITPTSGAAPLLVTFDGSRSFDASGGSIGEYVFDFGDGSSIVTQSSPTATHTYTTPGSYKPTLKVKNKTGLVSKAAAGSVAVAPSSGGGDGGVSSGKRGGGAFGIGLLLPLLGVAALRRRRRLH